MDQPDPNGCNRRNFLKTTALSTAALAMNNPLSALAGDVMNAAKLPTREFGSTGIHLSIIGMGGIVVKDADQQHANRIVAEFVERGVNYFDATRS